MSDLNELFESAPHYPEQAIRRTVDADLTKIRARLSAITPGPWRACLGSGYHLMTGVKAEDANGNTIHIADCLPEYALKDHTAPADHRPNLDFIEHAPTDIATLLDEIDRLTALVDDTEPSAAEQLAAFDVEDRGRD